MKFEFKIQFSWLNILIVLNILMFLVANLLLSMSPSSRASYDLVSLIGGFDYQMVSVGQVWLLITSGFLHFDLFHILINMYSLYRLGSIVTNFYNEKVLALTYILGSLGGSLLTFVIFFSERVIFQTNTNILSVGASSGIFALMGLLLGGTLRRSRFGVSFPFSFEDIIPLVLFSLFFGLMPGTNINNWAHLGGLITGLLLGLLLPHALGYRNNFSKSLENIIYRIAFLLAGLSFLALIINFIFVIFL